MKRKKKHGRRYSKSTLRALVERDLASAMDATMKQWRESTLPALKEGKQ